MIRLSSLRQGDTATVECVTCCGPMRRRLQDIGLVHGTVVHCLQKSFFGDPTAYLIKDAVIAIRKQDADCVMVSK